MTPLFILFARLGLLNNYLGMIFVYVSVSIPFSIYLLVGYLEAVPRSLDEAAILDGCSQFQVIWRIVFPIMLGRRDNYLCVSPVLVGIPVRARFPDANRAQDDAAAA